MFKINNKDTKTTPMVSFVSIVNFEHVIAGWELSSFLVSPQGWELLHFNGNLSGLTTVLVN